MKKVASLRDDLTYLEQLLESKTDSNALDMSTRVDFDYLLLSLNWPGSACMTLSPCKAVTPKYTNFTIHGLWPNNHNGRGPENCGEVFDYNKVQSLIEDLRLYWADFKPDEPNFWKHEFDKHGSCAVSAGVFKDQYDYFLQTINLVRRMPIHTALQSAGFIPSNTKTYHREELLSVVESAVGAKPFITCDKRKYVKEMRFCFDKQLKPMKCQSTSQGCDTNVILKPVF
jgi:ribonuclease T2